MDEIIKFKLDHLDELEVMEIKEELRRAGIDPDTQTSILKTEVPQGTFGVPPELSMMLEIAREAMPLIIGVFALWVAKGQEKEKNRQIKLSWSKDGITYEKLEYNKNNKTDTSDQIKDIFNASMATAMKNGGKEGTSHDSQLD